MKIALIAAEFEENLAMRYLWSAVEKRGHEVLFIRFNGPEEMEEAAMALAGSGASLAAYSMVFTSRALEFVRLAERAWSLGFRGYSVAGGHFATLYAEELLDQTKALHAVGCGEGEGLLVQLAEHLEDPSKVQGLVWRDAQGTIHRNGQPLPQEDLESIFPPVHRRPFDAFLGIPAANVIGSRGCLHSCSFCSISTWHRHCGGPRLRLRSPASIADEMASLYRDGVRIFNFHDDNFFLPFRADSLQRFQSLDREWKARGIRDIAFAVKARPDEIDEELVDCLLGMGLFRVFLGIEGGTETTLTQLGRGQRLADNERALEILGGRHLQTCFNLLLLNPDSTLEDFRANVAFLARHPEHPMNFCRTEIYAGTPLEARLQRQGRLLGDLWGLDYVMADPKVERVYEALRHILQGRSRGIQCLNHQAMLVDFELQLLERFHGGQESLRTAAQNFIRRLNGDTAQRLLRIAEMAESGQVAEDVWMERCEWQVLEALDAEAGFSAEAADLTRRIRALANPEVRNMSFRMRLSWAAAILVASTTLFGQSHTATPPKTPEPLQQDSELETFRREIGQKLAGSDAVKTFMSSGQPTFVLKVDLNKRGLIQSAQVLAQPVMILPAETDAAQTRRVPHLDLAARPNLAGCTLLIAFHQDEFISESLAGRMDVTLRPLETMICEVVAASPRDGVSIKKPNKPH
ncbi:MAG: B12-binding domain-containing radical SAM protein [Holophagaceae bacterium]|nr:B12-binding domain-containing radical SAM protein [Holophagaceae bacterium]